MTSSRRAFPWGALGEKRAGTGAGLGRWGPANAPRPLPWRGTHVQAWARACAHQAPSLRALGWAAGPAPPRDSGYRAQISRNHQELGLGWGLPEAESPPAWAVFRGVSFRPWCWARALEAQPSPNHTLTQVVQQQLWAQGQAWGWGGGWRRAASSQQQPGQQLQAQAGPQVPAGQTTACPWLHSQPGVSNTLEAFMQGLDPLGSGPHACPQSLLWRGQRLPPS